MEVKCRVMYRKVKGIVVFNMETNKQMMMLHEHMMDGWNFDDIIIVNRGDTYKDSIMIENVTRGQKNGYDIPLLTSDNISWRTRVVSIIDIKDNILTFETKPNEHENYRFRVKFLNKRGISKKLIGKNVRLIKYNPIRNNSYDFLIPFITTIRHFQANPQEIYMDNRVE